MQNKVTRWLELRIWDLLMWLDAHYRYRPAWRRLLIRLIQDWEACSWNGITIAALGGTTTGVLIGLLLR